MPTNTDNICVLNDMLAAYNAHDPERVASFYKDDAVIEVEGVQPTIRGRQAIAETFRARFEREVPDIRGRVLDAVADDNHIFSWLEYSGTPQGAGLAAGLEGSGMPASGHAFTNRLLDRMTIQDGKIADEYAVINLQALQQELASAEPAFPNEQANVASIRRLYEAHNTTDAAVFRELIDPACVRYSATTRTGGQWRSAENVAEGLVETLTAFHAVMPDLHWTIEDVLADGDKVAVRSRTSATARAEVRSPWGVTLPPTGKTLTWTELCVYRFDGGRVVEFWAEMDWVNILLQMGVVPGRTVVGAAGPAAEAPVREFCAAYTAHDLDRIMAVVADDCVAVYPTLARYDKATFRDLIAEELRAFPDAAINIITLVADERNASVEFWWDATQKGEFRGQPPSGQSFHLPCMLLFETRDGLLTSIRYYWNTRLWELHETT